jgi:hypothetical protein
MRKNTIPALIAFSPALLLPLAQDVLRPHAPHFGLIGLLLGSAPDFVIGFCFPFSILIRPRAWSPRVATILFHIWSAFTVTVLIAFEFYNLTDRIPSIATISRPASSPSASHCSSSTPGFALA